jgi:hypothetical protein
MTISPKRLNLRAANLPVPGDQRQIQSERRRRDYAVRQIRNVAPGNLPCGSGHLPVQHGQTESEFLLHQDTVNAIRDRLGNSSLVHQVDEFYQTDRRYVNRVTVGPSFMDTRSRHLRQSRLSRWRYQTAEWVSSTNDPVPIGNPGTLMRYHREGNCPTSLAGLPRDLPRSV